MKKLLLTMAVMLSALTASAWGDMYLLSTLNNKWSTSENENKFTKDGENKFYFDIPSTAINGDFWYRLFIDDTAGRDQIYPSDAAGNNYVLPVGQAVLGWDNLWYGDNHNNKSFKFEKPSYTFEKVRITAEFVQVAEADWRWKLTVDVYVPVEISNDLGYRTFTTPAPLNFEGVTGLAAYQGAVANGEALFTAVAAAPAGEGLLLAGAKATYSVPVAYNPAELTGNELQPYQATVAASDNATTNLVLMDKGDGRVGFCIVEDDFTLTEGTAFLQTATANLEAADAKDFLEINLGAEVTGINTVKAVNQNGVVYDLQGRRVANPTHGIYIVNGKKVVVK